jgi:hypothetical protein
MSACYKHIKTHEREVPSLHSVSKNGVIISTTIESIEEDSVIVEQGMLPFFIYKNKERRGIKKT